MEFNRRDFLKASAGMGGLMLIQPPTLNLINKYQNRSVAQSDAAMLVDVSKCIGCWWCYAACKNYNKLPETIKPDLEQPPELSPELWTTLYTTNKGGVWSSRKQACMHCTDASCEQVCPTGAISHQGAAVVIDQEWCVGCGYCVQACPFGVPHKDEHAGTARKCTFCIDRISNGEQPACAAACPTGAIQFGARTDLLTAAKTRVEVLKADGYPNANLYGEHTLGGLHILYVLTDQPSVYGLPKAPQVAISKAAFKWLAGVIAASVIAILPFWLLFRRKSALKQSDSP